MNRFISGERGRERNRVPVKDEGERDEDDGGGDADVEGEDVVAHASGDGGFEACVGSHGGALGGNHGGEWHHVFVKQSPLHLSGSLCKSCTVEPFLFLVGMVCVW